MNHWQRKLCILAWLSFATAAKAVAQQYFYIEFTKKDKPSVMRIMTEREEVVCKVRYSKGKRLQLKGELHIFNDSVLQVNNQPFLLNQLIYITARRDWWDRKLSALLMIVGGIAATSYGIANIQNANRNAPLGTTSFNLSHTLAVTSGITLTAAGVLQFALPGKYFFYNKYWQGKIKSLAVK
ncbi:MAG: hypothetical protein RMJ44_06515 [Cytophagales bacterium]|nr:hypothetical protein [Bernardetiaceae bacterium]MDW8210724.1 hypothetical protein [Cytophagales bacterium]